MRCSTSVPVSVIGEVITDTNVICHQSVLHLNRKLSEVLHNHNVDTAAHDVQELFSLIERFKNPFAGLETPIQQMNYMINNMHLVSPLEDALRVRYDQVVDHKTGQVIQKMVTDTFQYIPLLEVLKLVLNDKVRGLIESEMRREHRLPSYCDGIQFFQHGLFIGHMLCGYSYSIMTLKW